MLDIFGVKISIDLFLSLIFEVSKIISFPNFRMEERSYINHGIFYGFVNLSIVNYLGHSVHMTSSFSTLHILLYLLSYLLMCKSHSETLTVFMVCSRLRDGIVWIFIRFQSGRTVLRGVYKFCPLGKDLLQRFWVSRNQLLPEVRQLEAGQKTGMQPWRKGDEALLRQGTRLT